MGKGQRAKGKGGRAKKSPFFISYYFLFDIFDISHSDILDRPPNGKWQVLPLALCP